MDITVRGQHFRVNERIEEHARKKLERLERYLPLLREGAAEVDLTHEQTKEPDGRYLVRVTVSGRGVHLQTQERAAQPEAAIDLAAQVLSRQARRQKERLYERGRDSAAREATLAQTGATSPAEEQAEAPLPEKVARVKRFAVKPMTAAEALEQMEVLGHDFFLFHDAEAGQFALLYRRRNGDYGLIVPELS